MNEQRSTNPKPLSRSFGLSGALALLVFATLIAIVANATGTATEEGSASTGGPRIQLSSNPLQVVLEVWIGGGLIDRQTHLIITADGSVEITNPNRFSSEEETYAMDLATQELGGLLRELAEAGLFDTEAGHVDRLLEEEYARDGTRATITDNVHLLVSASFALYQRSAQAPTKTDFEHVARLPHPAGYAELYPNNEGLQNLTSATGMLTSLTTDARLERAGE